MRHIKGIAGKALFGNWRSNFALVGGESSISQYYRNQLRHSDIHIHTIVATTYYILLYYVSQTLIFTHSDIHIKVLILRALKYFLFYLPS